VQKEAKIEAENVPPSPNPQKNSGSQEYRVRLPFLSPTSAPSSEPQTPTRGTNQAANNSLKSPSFYLHAEDNSLAERSIAGGDPFLVPERYMRPGLLADFHQAHTYTPSCVRWLNPLVPSSGFAQEMPAHVETMLQSCGAMSRGLAENSLSTLSSLISACGWTDAQGATDNRIGTVFLDRVHDSDLLEKIECELASQSAKVHAAFPPYPTPIAIWDWHVLDHIEDLSGAESQMTEDFVDEFCDLRNRFLISEYRPKIDLCWGSTIES
jgi:hypothetical protein